MELSEFQKKKVKKTRIIDGKKVVRTEWEYQDVPDGYKVVDGKLKKMSSQERRNRSIAAKKSANKESTKRKRQISLRRRKSLVKESNNVSIAGKILESFSKRLSLSVEDSE